MFEELLNEELEVLEEQQVSRLKGSVRAFSQINTYSTDKVDGSYVITVSNMSGKIGTVEVNTSERKVYYYNERDQIVKMDDFSSNKVDKRTIENQYVPELINRVSSKDMFGFV